MENKPGILEKIKIWYNSVEIPEESTGFQKVIFKLTSLLQLTSGIGFVVIGFLFMLIFYLEYS